MGKKLLLAFAVLALALAAVAHDIDQVIFSNSGGLLMGGSQGLSLSRSTLTAVLGPDGRAVAGKNLGTLSLSTGELTSGLLSTGGTFAGGGSLTITCNSQSHLSAGTLFRGVFTGRLTWTLATLSNGTHQYTLVGMASGTLQGTAVKNVSLQLTINTGRGFYDGSAKAYSGTTTVSVQDNDIRTLVESGA
jgi:hypothetical protein